MKKFEEFTELLEGVLATAISGVFLLISLLLPVLGVNFPSYLNPAIVSAAISGTPLVFSAIKKLIKNKGLSKISSALLISVAMISAILIGDIFAAGEVAFIMALGEILEHKTTARAKKGIKNLISLSPETGRKILDGKEIILDINAIKKGDVLRVLPGERIPVDGEIIIGDTSVDQQIITGESMPVDLGVGDRVFCGTLNRFGVIDIVATGVGKSSSLSKLIEIVKTAGENKAPTERIADKWASILVPIAFLLAVIAGFVQSDIVAAVTVLVVFCPCALVLATPTAIMGAIGNATKKGVIIKSGAALETMGKIDTLCFDKTGTLTYGKPTLLDIISFNKDITEEKILTLAASVESKSEHPLGKAVVDFAAGKGLTLLNTADFKMLIGKGVSAKIEGVTYFAGSPKLLNFAGIPLSDTAENLVKKYQNQGKAVILLAGKDGVLGLLTLLDQLKPNAAKTVEDAKKLGLDTYLLTGDNLKTAKYFGEKLGVKNIKGELLPEEKVAVIKDLIADGKNVAMIGDGINDAPALKTALVGIAMGTAGSDISVDAADITVMGDDPKKILFIKKLANATLSTVKLGISLSLGINFLAIALSFLGILTPTTGALVHNLGALAVIFIASLLYDRKIEGVVCGDFLDIYLCYCIPPPTFGTG